MTSPSSEKTASDMLALAKDIQLWAQELGFQQTGIADTNLANEEARLMDWLDKGYHGNMNYMAEHGVKRSRPDMLLPGTMRVISVRLDYRPDEPEDEQTVLDNPELAYISRYALGRDYHKLMRKRLQKLAKKIEHAVGEFSYRVFVDSAPVLEKALAQKAGIGWQGKHTNIINKDAGSWFFLGEIYTDLPLPVDESDNENHCGTCEACIDICPTKAIIAPYVLDARRCISYLTIELKGSIPVELRSMMGNRIYGCDDCQMVCPWNKFAQQTKETDFMPRNSLDSSTLITLFNWTEQEFLTKTEGSAIRRAGYENWLRNIAIALGNATTSDTVTTELQNKAQHASAIVREHVEWALTQHTK
jgi:epoxyqueuosine reductase